MIVNLANTDYTYFDTQKTIFGEITLDKCQYHQNDYLYQCRFSFFLCLEYCLKNYIDIEILLDDVIQEHQKRFLYNQI